MKLCILTLALCSGIAFGATGPGTQSEMTGRVSVMSRGQPGFDVNDVARQVRSARSPLVPDLGRRLDGQFLIDTTSTLQPAPGSHQNAAVGFDGTNYLVVWEVQLGASYSNICGARVTPQGTVLDQSGILISDAGFDRGSPALSFDGTNFLVVWQDRRRGYAYHIYGARVTPDGQVLDPVSFVVSGGASDACRPAVAFDGSDFLVAWEDYRNDANHPDIYGARVSPGGLVLDTSNLSISINARSQWTPALGFDGANFLVTWCDLLDTTNSHIYGARVTPGGAVLDNNGFPISQTPGLQDMPSLSFDGSNYLVTWRHVRPFVATDIYGARVTPAGQVLDGGSGIRIAATDNVYSLAPAVGFDGTNFLVAWHSVIGMANFTIHGARVTPGGAVLDVDSSAIIIAPTAGWMQRGPAIGFDGANYLTVWQDERNKTGEPDLYGARVTPDGAVLDSGGFLITKCARGQYVPGVAFDGANFLAVWEDDRNGYTDIYGARVTPTGTVLDPDGIAICTAQNYQLAPVVAFDGTNFLVVWEDDRSDTTGDIHGARVTPGGQVLDPQSIVMSDAPGRQRSPAIGFAGGDYLVVWEDSRSGGNWDLYGTLVSRGGIVLNSDGIPISTAANWQWLPAIGFDGTDYLVVWEDTRNSGSLDIYGTRVTAGGQVLDPSGIAICRAEDRQYAPAIAFDGANYLVAWEDYRRSDYSDIFGTRVSKQGMVLDTAGIAISRSTYDQVDPTVAFDGTNFLLLWQDCCSSGKPDIFGSRVTPGGTLLDYGRVISQDGVQSNLAMTRGSDSHLFLVYQGWTGTLGGKTYNTDRIWGAMDPTPGGGVQEEIQPGFRPAKLASIVRGVLILPLASGVEHQACSILLDIGGRKVMDLGAGANDVAQLAPGVYFVREAQTQAQAPIARKVVIAR